MDPILLNKEAGMPRTDYPRPQWVREKWYSLNGKWEFAFDFGKSGEARGMVQEGEYPLEILVPFCPESKLSGIGYTDFISAVWYRRKLIFDSLPVGRAILHFGAVDYFCKVWVNGVFCGSHKGGYTAFEMDITFALKAGENIIVVYAEDDILSNNQPSGKQCLAYHSVGCRYTRTTGIYQTVWLEFVPESYLKTAKFTPHAADGALDMLITVGNSVSRNQIKLTAYYKDQLVGSTTASVIGSHASARLMVDQIHLWNPGVPELYDLVIELINSDTGKVVDSVTSYFALRDVALTDKALTINGRPVFMRTILDQGFHPGGVYTAQTDEELKQDIQLALDLGFNGARLHKRVFEERTLYWADQLGYLVWGEHASTSNITTMGGSEYINNFLSEWMETVEQCYNHPAVIGWACFNETYHFWDQNLEVERVFYQATKKIDPYRPVIDASGGYHFETDMFDVHDYEQDPEKFFASLEPMRDDPSAFHNPITTSCGRAPKRAKEEYRGQPYWISEFGGAFWNPDREAKNGWGYGETPADEIAFAKRYEELTGIMLSHPRVCGYCYTQLTDIEQEQNGLYRFERTHKFSQETYDQIRSANLRVAEIEKTPNRLSRGIGISEHENQTGMRD